LIPGAQNRPPLPGWLRRLWRFGALALTLAGVGLAALLVPAEQSLGANLRLVIVHGAWVWAGQIFFWLAAVLGLAAMVLRRGSWAAWCQAAGRTGLFFWLTYLPMSLLVMQLTWGGLYLDEPRWKVPFAFGVAGVLLQVGLAVMNSEILTSAGNLLFGAAQFASRYSIQNVLHPDSPLAGSASWRIPLSFTVLLLLSLAFGAQLMFWRRNRPSR
jgi:hypothetical protein